MKSGIIMKEILIWVMILAVITGCRFEYRYEESIMKNPDRLKPWTENPKYWQYKGEPVLLLGGSGDDNLFQWPAEILIPHLDVLAGAGGNYVRNTMSDRDDDNLKPFAMLSDGKYDLNRWNEDYWSRFENFLKLTQERDIIVQIEIWDRFDYSDSIWKSNPWNPGCNVNYSYEQTGLSQEYSAHPAVDKQPFFHSIQGMPLYSSGLDIVRDFQEKFVSKILFHSLKYGHVLYCMNNETSTPGEWGQYWIDYIKGKADEQGVIIYATDMFDDGYRGIESIHTPIIFKDTVHYMFGDISQVNSRNFDDEHWDKLIWLMQQINSEKPRPANHTKIYGGRFSNFGTGSLEDGVERFWRNILAGSASARFHRPYFGNGLNERAIASIKSARKLEKLIKFWDIQPHMELLTERQANEAYLAANPGEQYVIYFTYGGSVGLDLSESRGDFKLNWISITEGTMPDFGKIIIEGGSIVTITAPFKGGWIAALTRNDN